jgi:hypothetical protein
VERSRRNAKDIDADSVRSKRLTIVGPDGSARIELGTSNGGDAVLRMRDANGTVRSVLSVQEDSPRLRLLDAHGKIRLSAVLRDGEPGLELLDGAGRARMVLFLRGHDNDVPDLYFLDADGRPRFGISLDAAGQVKMEAQSRLGELREPLWFQREGAVEDEPLD